MAPLLAPVASGRVSWSVVGLAKRHSAATRWRESDHQRSPTCGATLFHRPAGGHRGSQQLSGILLKRFSLEGSLATAAVIISSIRMTRGNPHHHQSLSAQHGGKGGLEGPSMVSREPRGNKGSSEGQHGFYLHPPRPAASRRKGVSWSPRIR